MKRILLVLLAAAANPASADVYRCVAADGSTTFSQTPCSADAERVAVSSNRPDSGSADCAFADKFIRSTSRLMRQGLRKEELYEQYGGQQAFGTGAKKIVNYVYMYGDTRGMSQDRIAELAGAQCASGAFGAVNCETLPAAYVESGGGCGESFSAFDADRHVDVWAIRRAEADERTRAAAELRAEQSEKMLANIEKQRRIDQCRQKYQTEINRIETRIFAGADPNGERLELKRLRKKMQQCR